MAASGRAAKGDGHEAGGDKAVPMIRPLRYAPGMKLNHLSLVAAFALAACSQTPSSVRIAHDAPPPVATIPAPVAKTEPVFYNGKTYQVSFAPQGDGTVAVSIGGMSGAQGKDAAALSTSTLHHFNCKDSQKAILQAPPAYDGGMWKTRGRCG